jgi:hypothetical protein
MKIRKKLKIVQMIYLMGKAVENLSMPGSSGFTCLKFGILYLPVCYLRHAKLSNY